MKKRTKSQVALLKAAKDCFWKYGINKVTVEEICNTAGISKMTYYRSYANKSVVAQIVLSDLIQNSEDDFDKIMSKNIDFPQKIKEIILLEHEYSKGISHEFINDIVNNEDKDLKLLMDNAKSRGQDKLIAHLKVAQQEGWVRKDLHFPFLIYMMDDITFKLNDEKLIKMYASTEELIMELVNFFFYGIVSPEKI